jgi:phosphatidylglycerol---prolipoprotein diacylglyceryl transferase
VKPIPVVFHIGPLQIHTYGIGLAITFWVCYRYFARRLRAHGYEDRWLGSAFVWIIGASIVGARAVHVIANWGFYSRNLGDIFAVWHGGLSSYGGLALGVPTGLYLAHRWCKSLRLVVALDLVAPVLVLGWAIGRWLGPQLMVSGGGYPTTAWFGMYYAGQVGKRVPVPIFQGIECFVIYLIALQVEKYIAHRGGPLGIVVTATVTLYGGSRLFDESILIPHGPAGTAVEITSGGFIAAGVALASWLLYRDRGRERPASSDGTSARDPWANRATPAVDASSVDRSTDQSAEMSADQETASSPSGNDSHELDNVADEAAVQSGDERRVT